MDWIASAWSSSAAWESIEYAAEAIVIAGCMFEGLADFELILKGHDNERRRKRVETAAFLTLIIGLALGLTALVRTNHLFTETIATLYGEARDADNRAETAFMQATKAVKHGEELEAEAAILRARTEREIDARLALERQLVKQELRSNVLADPAPR